MLCQYRKGSGETKEMYVKCDVATWVDEAISELHGNDCHHSKAFFSSQLKPNQDHVSMSHYVQYACVDHPADVLKSGGVSV